MRKEISIAFLGVILLCIFLNKIFLPDSKPESTKIEKSDNSLTKRNSSFQNNKADSSIKKEENEKSYTLQEIVLAFDSCAVNYNFFDWQPFVLKDTLDPVVAMHKLFPGRLNFPFVENQDSQEDFVIWKCEKCPKLTGDFPSGGLYDTSLISEKVQYLQTGNKAVAYLFFKTMFANMHSGRMWSLWDTTCYYSAAMFEQEGSHWRLTAFTPSIFPEGRTQFITFETVVLGVDKTGFWSKQGEHCPGCGQVHEQGQLWINKGSNFSGVLQPTDFDYCVGRFFCWFTTVDVSKTEKNDGLFNLILVAKGHCRIMEPDSSTIQETTLQYSKNQQLAIIPAAVADYYRTINRPFNFRLKTTYRFIDGEYCVWNEQLEANPINKTILY